MSAELRAAVAAATGSVVVEATSVGGGDINDALRVRLDDGRDLFVKHRSRGAPPGMYPAEAHGLRWLGRAERIPVPEVVAVVDREEPRFLALGWIEPGQPGLGAPAALGRALARLHRTGAEGFGLDRDNYIGTLPQANGPLPTWAEFYAERRLLPLTRRAIDAGSLPARAAVSMERLCGRLDELAGPREPPARLHGDLWGGNAHWGADGVAYLVDPAVYGGHREVDLAMMRLFGGFSDETFRAYDEEHPLAPGHEDRVSLCQLYPLLVHAVLFGSRYGASVEGTLRRWVGR